MGDIAGYPTCTSGNSYFIRGVHEHGIGTVKKVVDQGCADANNWL